MIITQLYRYGNRGWRLFETELPNAVWLEPGGEGTGEGGTQAMGLQTLPLGSLAFLSSSPPFLFWGLVFCFCFFYLFLLVGG